MSEESRKRSAIEPASSLFVVDPGDVPTRRPGALVGGSVAMLFRVLLGIAWIPGLLREWDGVARSADLNSEESRLALGLILTVSALWLIVLLALIWGLWRGSNGTRMLILFWETLSITAAAVTFFAMGEKITVETTLLTLALDILILLALSSRNTREWTRARSEARLDSRTRARARRRSRRAERRSQRA